MCVLGSDIANVHEDASTVFSAARRPEERLFAWAALGLYVALGITLALHHEAWRDEADTWLIARDAPLSDLPRLLGRAGTPALWYAILIPFARAGMPYATQAVVHLVIASSAAALLFLYAPFPRLLKLLIAFSFYMGYEYLAIARPYALSVLLLFALATWYPRRLAQPLRFALLFALLVNSTVHAFMIGLAIGSVVALEMIIRRVERRWMAIAVMAAGGASTALPILLAGSHAVVSPLRHTDAHAVLSAVAAAFAPGSDPAAAVLGLAVFFAASASVARDRHVLVILWLSWAALLFIYVFVYRGTLRHFGFLFVAVVFALWVAAGSEPPRWARTALIVTLSASLVLSTAFAMSTWRLEMRYPFSGAKDAAAFLRSHHLERRPIAAHPPAASEAVLAYLPPRRFWYPAEGRAGSYMRWDAAFWKFNAMPPDAVMNQALGHVARGSDLLILSNAPLAIAPKYGLRLLYSTQGPVFGRPDERYVIYGWR